MYIPDHYDIWLTRDMELERALESLPLCSVCEEHIQDEHCYQINDELICESCMDNFKVFTMDVAG